MRGKLAAFRPNIDLYPVPSKMPQSGRPPWHEADNSFVGWVPTILGHLSFSMVGIKHRWSQHRSYNRLNPLTGERVVATLQQRTAQDFPIWDALLRVINPASTQNYLLTGTTCQADIAIVNDKEKCARMLRDTQGALAGTVYVIPRQSKSKKDSERKSLIRDIHNYLNPRVGSVSTLCEDLDQKIESYQSKDLIVHKHYYCLYRTGELRIWSSNKESLGYERDNRTFEENETVILNRLPRQVYYFIKDAAHSHYHHEPSSDQILPLVRMKKVSLKSGEPNHLENELSWRREVLWGLARVLARYRREGDLKQLKRAKGILAYADAFQSTLAKTRRAINIEDGSEYDDDINSYDFNHAKQSVDALDSLRTWNNAGNFQVFAGTIAIIFSASSFWGISERLLSARCSSAVDFLPPYCAGLISERTLMVATWVAKHPLVFSGFLAIPSIIIYSIFVKDIRDFSLARKPAHFLSSVSRAIGATLTSKFNNAYIGFAATVAILMVVLSFLIFGFVEVANLMQEH